jgi:hypothetical protein
MLPRAAPPPRHVETPKMILRIASVVRSAVGPALIACATLLACSNSPATPRTFIAANLGAYYDPMHNNQNTCPFGTNRDVLDIGTATADNPVRVKDGDTQQLGAAVQVTCTVSGGFDVSATAYLGGDHGGTVSIVGHVDTSGGQGIAGEIDIPGSYYRQTDCTVGFSYGQGSVPQNPPIAKGRIWAHLSCSKMVDSSGQMRMLMDGSQVPNTCRGDVDFIFENCSS